MTKTGHSGETSWEERPGALPDIPLTRALLYGVQEVPEIKVPEVNSNKEYTLPSPGVLASAPIRSTGSSSSCSMLTLSRSSLLSVLNLGASLEPVTESKTVPAIGTTIFWRTDLLNPGNLASREAS